MPKQPSDEEALARLGRRVDALEARTRRKRTGLSAEGSGSGAGYSMVAELVSGVLGGLGLGWLFDKYAHTSPVGLIVGVLLGTVAGIFLVVKTASRFSDQAQKRSPGEPVPFDDEDET
jgi:ATP synthase protein I